MSCLVNDSLWNTLRSEGKRIENSIENLQRKQTGSYYTDLDLTDSMMEELTSHLFKNEKPIWEYRFLEPCVGTGNFVFSYLKCVYKYGVTKEEATILLNNIYVADINSTALEKYAELLSMLVENFWNIHLDQGYFDNHIGKGLLIDVTSSNCNYIRITDVFSEDIVKDGFDIVVTNPPYKNLKAERSQYLSEELYNADKVRYSSIANIASTYFRYSNYGTLNLYKLFVEEIIDRYTTANAHISLLVPTSILSDKTCTNLRSHILLSHNLLSVKTIEEDSDYVDAKQSLSAILIHKGSGTKTINIVKNYTQNPMLSVDVDVADILSLSSNKAIIPISKDEYDDIKMLSKFPTIADLPFIHNYRGELDLTANKKSISSQESAYKLIRGRNIAYYSLSNTESIDYVSKEFVDQTNKKRYIHHARLACQQIANMKKDRRVTFALVPENYVLGNSCNFIYIEENNYDIDLYAMLGLLNSKLINWYFKLTSSNNHINNYEIDNFPVPVNSNCLKTISILVRKSLDSMSERAINLIEKYVRIAYNLDEDITGELEKEKLLLLYYADIKKIIANITLCDVEDVLQNSLNISDFLNQSDKFDITVAEGITTKYKALFHGYILNHTTFKLSDLDLEMISSVPQGGSWKDIPLETVEKSVRLKRITQTGGRTTLYGRIDYSKPSYTITTYFNRPGNGTYVHPVHERVLSGREAARFQGFPDDYYFFGNKTQLLKQVGNAVPCILAYQIAHQIAKKTGCQKSVDLFCGAGGMTAGFKEAGIQSVIANDIESSACATLKINNPEIEVLCGDITTEDTKRKITEVAIREHADIICGGPPCQGFSLAGFRNSDDPRNRLVLDFIDIVSRIKPKVIVFENVEGLLSFNRGATYTAIHNMFSDIGYNTEGRLLIATNYAVPQKRKRVIIICVRKDLDISPSQLFPTALTPDVSTQISAFDTISDLESIDCNEDACYIDTEESEILRLFKGKISFKQYTNNFIRANPYDNLIPLQDGQLLIDLA